MRVSATAACLLLTLYETNAHASRPGVSLSFVNSPGLSAPDLLRPLFVPATRTAAVTPAGLDAADVVAWVITLPVRLVVKLGALLGRLVPDRLPDWWSPPEASAHLASTLSILCSNVFYLHFALKQFRSKRPLLGCCLLAAAGASMFYHGFQIFAGAASCLTHKACYVDTAIAVSSGAVYVARCGLPRPHLGAAASALFFLAPSCGPLYAVSHSAWHFVSAYTAHHMAECAAVRHLGPKGLRAGASLVGGGAAGGRDAWRMLTCRLRLMRSKTGIRMAADGGPPEGKGPSSGTAAAPRAAGASPAQQVLRALRRLRAGALQSVVGGGIEDSGRTSWLASLTGNPLVTAVCDAVAGAARGVPHLFDRAASLISGTANMLLGWARFLPQSLRYMGIVMHAPASSKAVRQGL